MKARKRRVMSSLVALLILAGAIAAHAQQRPDVAEGDDGFSTIELDSGFTFRWKIDGDEIEAIISGPTTGWVSVGFNPQNRMQGGTYVIGYVQRGEVNMRHDWGHSATGHRAVTDMGGTSRLTSLGGSEEGGVTELSFRLPLDPGDRYFSPIRTGETNTVIWAFGQNGANSFTAYHAQRGTILVDF